MTDRNTGPSGDTGRQFQRRYRNIFQHGNGAVMIVDLERDEFLDANPTAEEPLGYEREQLLDLHLEAIHPDDLQTVRNGGYCNCLPVAHRSGNRL